MKGQRCFPGALLVLVAIVTSTSAQTCPEVCFCAGTTVQCESLSEEFELQRSVRYMAVATETLLLNDYRDRAIQSRTFFRLTELKTLRIESGRLLFLLERDTFLGLSKLENLTISGTAIQSFPNGLFEPLAKLNSLYIINTPVRSLGDTNFIGLTRLQHLRIINNGRLTTISKKAFEPLVNLQTLSLDGAIKVTPSSGLFKTLSKLTSLDLSRTKVSSPIERGTFEGLTKLETLIMRKCGLKSLERDLLSPMGASLQVLDISSNEITVIKGNTFADCTKLSELNLSENLRSTRGKTKPVYEAKAFHGLGKLDLLDISKTDLSNFTSENWIKMLKPVKKANVSAEDVNYRCSCDAAELANWLRRNDVMISLSCEKPAWIAGSDVKSIELDELKCTKPVIGATSERFQVDSPGKANSTATVVCEAFTFQGFPTLTYEIIEGEPFPEDKTSEKTENILDDESRYKTFLTVTIEEFNDKNEGKIRCKATNSYGYTEWEVPIPRVAEAKEQTESKSIFRNLPIWILGSVGVGALVFIIIFGILLGWRINRQRRERQALKKTNNHSDYYLESEKYEKYVTRA